jgi:PAS domain S-box-containing protein
MAAMALVGSAPASAGQGAGAELHELAERLQESETRFRIMADCAPVLLWLAEPDGHCSFFNKVWLDFTGRSMEQEIGNGWAEGVHFEDFERCMSTYLDSFVKRQPFRMEYRLRHADGQYRWLLDTGVPRFTPAGAFAGYVGSCIDITELKQAHETLQRSNEELERRVSERTAELTRSNEELEQFAYVVSHDLQAPLRTITGFIGLLQKRYKGRLDADADEFLGYIVGGADSMRSLIRDLLAYSRAGRSAAGEIPVTDSGAVVAEVLERLKAAISEKKAEVVVGSLPAVRADPLMLGQVFQNLIDNGLKFRKERTPRIEVNAVRDGAAWHFTISDNGIGIPEAQQARLFRVFQRLHTQEEYPGTGVGLAICKKVIERHGGRIWLESQPGKGTRFHFTLPAASDA